jgi:hypothetical protein
MKIAGMKDESQKVPAGNYAGHLALGLHKTASLTSTRCSSLRDLKVEAIRSAEYLCNFEPGSSGLQVSSTPTQTLVPVMAKGPIVAAGQLCRCMQLIHSKALHGGRKTFKNGQSLD